MVDRAELERYAAMPSVRIMLDTISRTEGTYGGKNSYAVYGGKVTNQLPNLAAHPGSSGAWNFRWNDGRVDKSTAAGRYQMIAPTWERLAKQYGFTDFSERNQDLAAIALMAERGALKDIVNQDYQAAMQKLGRTWASLPSSKAAQAKRSQDEFNRFLTESMRGLPAQMPAGSPPAAPNRAPQMQIPKTDTVRPTEQQQKMVGLADLNLFAPNLSKDELAAIMPEQAAMPTVRDTFFAPVKVDWQGYYN